METLELAIDGMTCGHCVAAVRGALERIEGVQVEEVQIGSARVRFEPAVVGPDQIAEAVADEGYQAHGAS